MINSLFSSQWLVIALVFFGIIGYISWIRWRDNRWIEQKYGRSNVIAMSFGVNYFGRMSEPGKPDRSSGFLVLLKDRLVFRSRWTKQEVVIPGAAINRIYPDSAHKGVDLHQSVMKVDFEMETGKPDSVAFRVPYPPQWINAIRNICPRLRKEMG
jgi:hypothetical protein